MMKGIIKCILYPAAISVAYWVTDAIIREGILPSIMAWLTIKTLALLIIPIAILTAIAEKGNLISRQIVIMGFCSPLWIWLLSIVYIPVINVLQGKDAGMSLRELGILLLWFPIMAIEVSTYSGGLLGLALASIGLPMTAIIMAKRKERSSALFQPTGNNGGTWSTK